MPIFKLSVLEMFIATYPVQSMLSTSYRVLNSATMFQSFIKKDSSRNALRIRFESASGLLTTMMTKTLPPNGLASDLGVASFVAYVFADRIQSCFADIADTASVNRPLHVTPGTFNTTMFEFFGKT